MAERIGLISGAGTYPILFAKEAAKAGNEIVTAAFKDITPNDIEKYSVKTEYFKLGKINAPIQFFKENGVKKAVMAGSVPHVSIFGGIFPDLRAIKILTALKDKRANSLLTAIANELKSDGIELLSSASFLESMLAKEGLLCGKKLSKETAENAAFGWKAAKAISELDIGLTVVLREKVVYAVEGQEGTDKCILRAGELLKSSGDSGKLMVVKVARPNQDMRFDLPVVGVPTLKTMNAANADTLILEADKTLILDLQEFIAAAKTLGITVFVAKDKNSFKC